MSGRSPFDKKASLGHFVPPLPRFSISYWQAFGGSLNTKVAQSVQFVEWLGPGLAVQCHWGCSKSRLETPIPRAWALAQECCPALWSRTKWAMGAPRPCTEDWRSWLNILCAGSALGSDVWQAPGWAVLLLCCPPTAWGTAVGRRLCFTSTLVLVSREVVTGDLFICH